MVRLRYWFARIFPVKIRSNGRSYETVAFTTECFNIGLLNGADIWALIYGNSRNAVSDLNLGYGYVTGLPIFSSLKKGVHTVLLPLLRRASSRPHMLIPLAPSLTTDLLQGLL
jgi:hypothetical protein